MIRVPVFTAQRTIGLAKELGIKRWLGVGNKVDTEEARQAIGELCIEHEVPLDRRRFSVSPQRCTRGPIHFQLRVDL